MIESVSVIIVLMAAPDATDMSVEMLAQPVTIYTDMAACQSEADRLNALSNSFVGFMLANGYWFCTER